MTLRAIDLVVRVGAQRLVDGVTLALEPGHILAVVGPNGAGKSTLLRSLAGDFVPSEGRVEFDGIPLSAWKAKELARRRSVVRQRANVAFDPTVLDVVLIGAIAHEARTSRSAQTEAARDHLRRVGLEGFAARLYGTLSGGEQQRVQIARALFQLEGSAAASAQFLLLDEPTASLDPRQQHEVLGIVREAATARCGVMIVLHDVQLALLYTDEVVALDRGRVVARGRPSEVIDEAFLKEVYGVRGRRCDGEHAGVLVEGLDPLV